MGTKLASLFILGLMLAGVGPAQASTSGVSTAIESFVAKLFPKASHYFWIVNDTKSDTQREMIVDINTVVTNKVGDPPTQNRFLLLLVNGQVLAAQSIPLGANVDCGDEEV